MNAAETRAARLASLKALAGNHSRNENREAAEAIEAATPALVAGAPLLTLGGFRLPWRAVRLLTGGNDSVFNGLSPEHKANVLTYAVAALYCKAGGHRPHSVDVRIWAEVMWAESAAA